MHSSGNQTGLDFGKIFPFFATVVSYFVLFISCSDPSSFVAVITKCAPIVSLMYFVSTVSDKNHNFYSKRIFRGLLFCCIGDAFLIWKSCFLYGMLSFTLGHVNYIGAFGFEPLRIKLLLYIVASGLIVVAILFNGLSGLMKVGVPFYILVICVMVWRASARIKTRTCTWIQLATSAGSILFALSDFVIGLDKFIRPIAHSQVLIMSSYYAAQLGISLSVLESKYI